MGTRVTICEVGPRDGLQNVTDFVDTQRKLEIIDGIIASGVKHVQVTSFMNPKAVPQMADAQEVAETCLKRYGDTDVTISALIANLKGADRAVASGLQNLSFVTSASESHNMANVRKTIDQSVEELKELLRRYPQVNWIWDVSMAFGCAFEGPLSDDTIARHVEKGANAGVRVMNLCDSNGIGTPDLVAGRLRFLLERFPECKFRVHIHDTRNMGMLNTLTAIHCGITEVETAICGLGGCPFFPGASGNTSTEDLVYMLNEMGYETGIDFDRLLETAKFTKAHVNGNFSGHHINIHKNMRCQG